LIVVMATSPGLRLATPDDAAAIAAIYAPVLRDTAITFEVEPVGTEEMGRRVATTLRRHPWLVAEIDGKVAGYAYAAQHRTRSAYDWSADVSVYLAPQARRRGLGRALYIALLDLLTAQGFANAVAGIALPNDASVRLHESLGFTAVGVYRSVGWKLSSWHDVGWWQLRLTSSDAPPQPLLRLSELPASRMADALAAGAQSANR
jgi:L-amino acid N-acyltransferase YncA